MQFASDLHVLVAASEDWDRRIREAWEGADGGAPLYSVSLAAPAGLPPGRWALAIVEYARGDALRETSPFHILRDSLPDLPVVVLVHGAAKGADAASEAEATIVEALRAGAVDCVSPARAEQLRAIVEQALEKAGAVRHGPGHPRMYPTERLLEMARAMLSEYSASELLQRAVEGARELTGALVSAAGYGRDGEQPAVTCSSQAKDASACPPGGCLDGAALVDAFSSEQGAITPRAPWRPPPAGHAAPQESLGARLVAEDGRPSGFLAVANKRAGDFDAEDEAALARWGALVSLGLQRLGACSTWYDITGRQGLLAENRNQRAFLEALLTASSLGIAIVRADDGVIEMANPAYCASTGAQDMPIVGRAVANVFPSLAADGVLERIARAVSRGETVTRREYRAVLGSDGGETFWDIDCIPLREADGSCARVLVLASDVTERVRQRHELEARARALADERALLRAIIDNAPEGIVVADREARVLFTNAVADLLYARPVPYGEEYDSHARLEIGTPDGRPVPPRELPLTRSALDGETVHDAALMIHWPDGQYRALLVNTAPLRDATGKPNGAVGVFQDVTERRAVKEHLLRQQAVLAGINRTLQAAITCETEEQLADTCLRVALELTGSACGFIGEVGPDGLLHSVAISDMGWARCGMHKSPSGHPRLQIGFTLQELYGRVLSRGESLLTNNPSAHPDSTGTPEGHPPLTAFLGVPLRDGGEVVGMIAVANREGGYAHEQQEDLEAVATAVREAILRKRAEQALRESEERYHTLFASIDEGFCLVEVLLDADGKPADYCFLEVNPSFEKQTGLHDVVGKRMRELEPRHEEHWFQTYGRVALTGVPERFTHEAQYLGRRWYDVYAFRVGQPEERKVAILFLDISERRAAEAAIESIARFPDENPDPVLRVARDGTLLYANEQATPLLSAWGCEKGWRVPEAWLALVTTALQEHHTQVRDLAVGSSVYSLRVVPISGADYANVYGRDVTAEREAEEASQAAGRNLVLNLAQMTRLQELSTRLVHPDDLSTLLHEILAAAAELTGTARGNIQYLDESTDRLRIAVHQGLSDAYVAHFAEDSCATACGAAQRSKRRVILEDVREEPLLQGTEDLELFEAEGIRSITSTPLLGRDGRLLGVMSNHYSAPRRPTEHELQLIDLLARMAADVIARSHSEEALRASETRLREVLENSRDAIYRLDLITGTYQYFSPAIEVLTGHTPAEMVGRSAAEGEQIIHPDDRDTFRAHSLVLAASEERSPADVVECRMKTKHAGYRWFSTSRRLVRDSDGRPVAVIGATRDIEEQKRAELAMARRLEDLAILAGASQVLSREASEASILTRACELTVERFGLRLAWIGLLPEDDANTVTPTYAAGHDEGYIQRLAFSPGDPNDQLPVTRALRTGEPVVVRDCATDPDFRPAWRGEALARGLHAMVALPLTHDGRVRGVLVAYSDEPDAFDDERTRTLLSLASLAAAGLEKARLHELVRRHAEDLEQQFAARTSALRASEARFRAVFEDSALGIALLDGEGRLLAINPALEELLGSAGWKLLGQSFTACLAPGLDKEQWLQWYLDMPRGGNSTAREEVRWRRGDGQLRLGRLTVSIVRAKHGTPPLAVAMLEDITEERQARAALVQAERLNVTGQLTAAFAHEVKNPLQAVIGCLGLLDETLANEVDVPQKAFRYLQVARDELRRADRVVNRLREFHRRDNGPAGPTSLRDLLEQVVLVTQRQCENQLVETILEVPADLPLVTARRDEIQQLFLNLVLNALDAMPEGGVLHIAAEPTQDPDGVQVRIRDNGTGIPEEALPHVFEFLYTTKKQGTGLGLFVCQEIVRNHGGDIMVESEVGVGTTFTVWLRE